MSSRRYLRFTFLAGIMAIGVTVAFSQVGSSLFATDYAQIKYHDPNSPTYIDACTACHGDRTNELSLDPTIQRAHSRMIFLAASSQSCRICHVPPDLIYGSAAGLRQQVDRASCATRTCHGAASDLPFYAVNSEETGVDDWQVYDTCPVSGATPKEVVANE